MKIRSNTWLISDTHFGHDNITKFGQRPKNHESVMMSKWCSRIQEDDTVLHLGDIVLCKGTENAKHWLRVIGRLPGRKYLILGNHDKEAGPIHQAYRELAGFELIPEFATDLVAFTHRPITDAFPHPQLTWKINVHGHTHRNEFNPVHDGVALERKTYINVCVEHTGLGPVQVGNILPGHRWTN